eukprot:6356597-Amphidinium_carterae.1
MEHPYRYDPAYDEAGVWEVLDAEEQQDWLYPTVQDIACVGGKPTVGLLSGAHPVTTKVPSSYNALRAGSSRHEGTAEPQHVQYQTKRQQITTARGHRLAV